MDVKEIKKLIDLMVKNDLRELEIRDGDCQVSLKRGPGEAVPAVTLGHVQPISLAAAQSPTSVPAQQEEAGATDEEFTNIISPMVGTFYHAASPEEKAFIQAGDKVTEDSVVCIIEAMKVMNEIKAGLTGTVEKVLISNGEAVEFGQTIFQVRPA